MKMRKTLERYLVDTKRTEYFIVSDILAFFTVFSIVSIVLETMPGLVGFSTWFAVIEWLAVAVFTAEYVARIIVSKPARTYIFSFYGIIDLVSIVPTFLGLGNLTFLKSARAVRLIRLLRMVRLVKMKNLKVGDVEERMGFFAVNIALFITVLVTSMLFVGTLIYLVEGNTEAFVSIPHGMLWSFKVFLIGIPITYPETVGGQLVHMLARLVGLTVFGVLIGIVGNLVKDYLFAGKKK